MLDLYRKVRRYQKKEGLLKTLIKICSTIFLKVRKKKYFEPERICVLPGECIKILTPGHTLFVAELMKKTLEKINLRAEIITSEKKNENSLYIVICPQVFKKLPSKRVIFFKWNNLIQDGLLKNISNYCTKLI